MKENKTIAGTKCVHNKKKPKIIIREPLFVKHKIRQNV